MIDIAAKLGGDFASGLTGYYARRQTHYRKLAIAAYREWQEHCGLADKYRLLEKEAAAVEKPCRLISFECASGGTVDRRRKALG